MSGNSGKSKMYLIVGALVAAVIGMGLYIMNDKANEPDLSISVSEDGIDIDGN